MILQLAFVLTAIIIGARLGGIGLGVMGGVGLAILTFVFGLQPTAPPIDVMLMIAAVISAASCMQAAGGLDYMVKLAEHLLRKNPSHVTLLSPLVTYLFTFVAGTGHVAYSVLPVIAEVATETKIRPERPLGIAVIASQQAITASPISAATVALLGLLAGFDITLFDILKITIPATIVGVLVGALFSMKVGKELVEDPEYQKRLKEGLFNNKKIEIKDVKNKRSAMISVLIFILATAFIVLFGSFEGMRPSFLIDGEIVTLGMSSIIEIVMLSAAAIILLVTKTDGIKATQGSVFPAGMQAVIAIFGIAWMGDTFLQGNMGQLTLSIEGIVQQMPWLFGVALFVMSILLYSPGCHSSGTCASGHCVGDFALYADRLVSGSKRIFLYSELPYCSGCYQFRPYRDNKNRQVCVESFVYDARLGIDDCCHCPGTALYTNILIYIYY